MQEILIATITSAAMALSTVLLHFEALTLISRHLHRFTHGSRKQVIFVILATLSAHVLEVLLYALAILLIDQFVASTSIHGPFDHSLAGYLYYSLMSYTSLGMGEIYPTGALRLISAFETLNGLLLIGWSASFTYLVMERRWKI